MKGRRLLFGIWVKWAGNNILRQMRRYGKTKALVRQMSQISIGNNGLMLDWQMSRYQNFDSLFIQMWRFLEDWGWNTHIYIKILIISQQFVYTVLFNSKWMCALGIAFTKPKSNKCHANKCHTNKCHLNKCHTNKCHSNKCHTNKCHTNKCLANKCHTNNCHANKCHANKCHANKCGKPTYPELQCVSIPHAKMYERVSSLSENGFSNTVVT